MFNLLNTQSDYHWMILIETKNIENKVDNFLFTKNGFIFYHLVTVK